MATKKKALQVELEFDVQAGRWDAFIGGELYGQHRWERRAFERAVKRYLQDKNIPPKEAPTFEVDLKWPPEMKKALKVFDRALLDVKEAEEALRKAKEHYDIVCAQYVAAWRDAGISKSGSVEMVDVSMNTVQGYIDRAGGSVAAAKAMWKKAGVKKSAGMLERASPRTNPSGSKTPTTEDGISPFYKKRPK